ncbi:MAG: FAD binding domain-containing protein [Planctomycetota bacterium]|nr:FAD binding domain-containing protein [Planctomycetota bacterium]
MKSFKYTAATSASGACRMLGENSLAFAGGTSLLNLMKEYVVQPDVLVDIKTITGLGSITREGSGLRIGANVTLAEILDSDIVRQEYPALHQALYEAGSPQIRNRGTLGGNLCARPACWYFSHGNFECAKKGGGGCPAIEGDNEFHAVFDTDGPCVMVHPSSSAPALLALGARVGVAGPETSRELPLGEFFTAPVRDVRRENILAANEIVTHVTLGPANARSATYEVRQKAAHDWPICLASVALDVSFGVCQRARVFLGAVAPVPRRAPGAEAALQGKPVTEAAAEAAGRAAVDGARPLSGNAYKLAAIRAAVKRAVLLAGTGKWN